MFYAHTKYYQSLPRKKNAFEKIRWSDSFTLPRKSADNNNNLWCMRMWMREKESWNVMQNTVSNCIQLRFYLCRWLKIASQHPFSRSVGCCTGKQHQIYLSSSHFFSHLHWNIFFSHNKIDVHVHCVYTAPYASSYVLYMLATAFISINNIEKKPLLIIFR